MKKVDERLERMILSSGYERNNDVDGSARYTKQDNTVVVSGYMVLVRSGGMWRPFSIERTLKTGLMMLERLARIIPDRWDGTEDRTHYEMMPAPRGNA